MAASLQRRADLVESCWASTVVAVHLHLVAASNLGVQLGCPEGEAQRGQLGRR